MNTTALASAIIGFLLGGFVVSLAASQQEASAEAGESMSQMTTNLRDKTGDAYDAAFIDAMIKHHQGAVDMAELSKTRAEHAQIEDLSVRIVTAQEREIAQMRAWQKQWGYDSTGAEGHSTH